MARDRSYSIQNALLAAISARSRQWGSRPSACTWNRPQAALRIDPRERVEVQRLSKIAKCRQKFRFTVERLRQLPIHIEHRPAAWLGQQILPLARTNRLTAYDAAYLELAVREGLPLATIDGDLRKAASAAGAPLVEFEP